MNTLTPQPIESSLLSKSKKQPSRAPGQFYVLVSVLALLIVIAGFSLTYIKPMFAGSFSGSATVHFHGFVFFAWLLLFIAQPLLVKNKQIAMHRKIGTFGFLLAVTMVIMGVYVALVSASEGRAGGSDLPATHFLIVPLTDMVLFATFITLALVNLKKSETHKRLMLLATVAILPAAFGRLFSYMEISSPVIMLLMLESIVLLGIVFDLVKNKSVHKVYLWGGGIMFLVHLVRMPLGGTETWRSIASWLVSLV